jgi:hypothetical protein
MQARRSSVAVIDSKSELLNLVAAHKISLWTVSFSPAGTGITSNDQNPLLKRQMRYRKLPGMELALKKFV